jgi:hypothetical protein
VKSTALSLVIVCGTMLVTALPVRSESIGEDVPVPGGLPALASLANVSRVPDRARFVAELARIIYSSPSTGPYSNEPIRRRIDPFAADARPRDSGASGEDTVPVPLTTPVWGQTILHRQVEPRDLVRAILADQSAALMCYGLAGMDDETLEFFSAHPSLLSRLAERTPAVVAAFGESLHVRGDRVVPPGGDAAAGLWEGVVGEKLDRAERFVQILFESDRGRTAYLWDVLSHLDPPALAFALESGIRRPDERLNRFKRLAALARRGFAEWDVTIAPFARPQNALDSFFARARLDSDGALIGLASPAFWQRAFDSTGAGAQQPQPTASGAPDAAWLAEFILGHPVRERERRIDAFMFGQRVFGDRATAAGEAGQTGRAGGETDDMIAALRAFAPYPLLMLTLERVGIRTPSTYVAGIQQAVRLADLDQTRGSAALAQFQGALALLSRLVRMRTIDSATFERLARDLFACDLNDGRYNGAIAAWMNERLRAALAPAAATPPDAHRAPAWLTDDVLLSAVAGPRAAGTPRIVEWEGQRYRVDVGGAELQRLIRVREKQAGARFETILELAALARRLGGSPATMDVVRGAFEKLTMTAADLAAVAATAADRERVVTIREAARELEAIKRPGDLSDARKVSGPLTAAADVMLGEALVSLAYACELGDPEGTILIAGDPSVRHDFGFSLPSREARAKAMWSVALTETRNGPSHLVGSVLGLDLAMAPLALRRITLDHIPEAPMLNMVQRDGFAATVAVMDSRALTDEAVDRIAEQVARGRLRLQRLDFDAARTIARELGMDGWRSRALEWTVRHEPDYAPSLLTMTELLVLGGGTPSAFAPWGTYALRTRGCLCAELASPEGWRSWWGLWQVGLPAALVSDLPLRVAVVLHNLQLPAELAKPVLAAATQDFVDSVNPTDSNDWLTLARAAQAIGPERFEDYVAAATADGPLLPEADR